MEKLDYHAKLTIHGLPAMDGKTVKRLVEWLRLQAHYFEQKQVDMNYAKRYTARLMK